MDTKDNLYKLDGKVSIAKAIPIGLQHVLAMFVSNVTPIIILLGVINADQGLTASLVQNAMIIAGIGTMVQLYPVWKIGSRLPIVMGVSFTFLSLAISVGLGFTQTSAMFNIFPEIIKTVFAENCVAVIFILALLLDLILSKEK